MESTGDAEWVLQGSLALRRSRRCHELVMQREKREGTGIIGVVYKDFMHSRIILFLIMFLLLLASSHSPVTYKFFMDSRLPMLGREMSLHSPTRRESIGSQSVAFVNSAREHRSSSGLQSTDGKWVEFDESTRSALSQHQYSS